MAIQLLAVTESLAENSVGIQGASNVVGEALAATDGELLRVWDAPDSSSASHVLVVQDPPDVNSTAALIAEAGLTLDSIVPVVPLEASGGAADDEQQIIGALPETTPGTLLFSAPFRADPVGYSIGMCPTCGGWGAHLYQHA